MKTKLMILIQQKVLVKLQQIITGSKIPLLFPIGHFYSPIANPLDITERAEKIWHHTDTMLGIDLNIEKQLELLEHLKPYVASIDYPIENNGDDSCFFYKNDQYPALDAEFLYTALCHFKPKTMIEIGSGYSSLITADVNKRILNNQLNFYCIEPYPRQFLLDGVAGITQLIQKKVEDIEQTFFDCLNDGDILFIDSSHVSKIGSDVNFLFFEIIPRLKKGVIVHIHDILLPDEYPKSWAIEQGRNWNEQYLLRAFLQFNSDWEVMWSTCFMQTRYSEKIQAVFPRFTVLGGGGSFWIRRIK